MTKQQQQIIQLVDIIFQNVGIKRCIDKIDILQTYQIYFEICKVIFPQTMIQLLRFSQGIHTNSQKIQAVINIVGKILQNDLYHISGQSISQGKLSHIRNFLHILELLSQNVHKGNRNEEEVESAPENNKSLSDYDQEGHYTVIGIDKQFQRQYEDQQEDYDNNGEQEGETKRENIIKNVNNNNQENQREKEQTDEDSQSDRPMNPILDKKLHSNKKLKKNNKFKQRQPAAVVNVRQVKPKEFIKSKPDKYRLSRSQKIKNAAFDQMIKKSTKKPQIFQSIKSSYIKKTNNIQQQLQSRKLDDLRTQHNNWLLDHKHKNQQKQNQINQQNKQRIEFTNQLIFQRKKKINTLRNAKDAVNMMTNLFTEQKQIWKAMNKAKQSKQLQKLQSLIVYDQQDQQLLRDALMAGNGVKKEKKRTNQRLN